MGFLQQGSTKYFRMPPWLSHCCSKGFSNSGRAVKHLEPACAVMLFPPTNPFLILAVQTIPGSFYTDKSEQTPGILPSLFLGSWVPELLCKAQRGHLLVHFAY